MIYKNFDIVILFLFMPHHYNLPCRECYSISPYYKYFLMAILYSTHFFVTLQIGMQTHHRRLNRRRALFVARSAHIVLQQPTSQHRPHRFNNTTSVFIDTRRSMKIGGNPLITKSAVNAYAYRHTSLLVNIRFYVV